MVKKLAILGVILVASAGMAWAGTYSGAIAAPAPTVIPAAAPACYGGVSAPAPAKVKAPCKPPKITTTIAVKMKYPVPKPLTMPRMIGSCAPAPPPIPVAVPMYKFVVPWPPYVYYLPMK